MVKAKELTLGMSGVEIELEIVEILGPRTISHMGGGEITVVQAVGKDETGQVNVQMRSEQAASVKVGSKVRIQNGMTTGSEDELMVTAGMYGLLTIIT